jgi:hypothetical protein
MGCIQTITYGRGALDQITLPYTTLEVSSTNEYDESGSRVAVAYDVTVSGVIVAESGETSLRERILKVQRYLNTPRLRFTVQWTDANDVTQIAYQFGPPALESADPVIDWGPYPQTVDINEFTGGLAASYVFRMRARTHHVFLGGTKTAALILNPIISYVRKQAFEISTDGLTTRTTSGALTIARNPIGQNIGADYYRGAVEPPLPDGFQRTRQRFDVSADYLTASFEFVDVELATMLPALITDGEASVNSINAFAELPTFRLSGRFSAPKTTPRSEIIKAIYGLAQKIIPPGVQTGTSGGLITRREMTATLYGKNEIAFAFEWYDTFITTIGVAFTPSAHQALLTAGSDNKTAVQVGPWGTAGLSAYVSATPYDEVQPNTAASKLKQAFSKKADPPGNTVVVGGATPAPGTLPLPANDRSDVAGRTVILDYLIRRTYEQKYGRRVMVPKTPDLKPLAIQTQVPHQYVIEAGRMRFLAKNVNDGPAVPKPPPGVLIESSVEVGTPTPVAGGLMDMHVVAWRYIVLDSRRLEGGGRAFEGLWIDAPANVLRKSGEVQRLTNGPDGIVPRLEDLGGSASSSGV